MAASEKSLVRRKRWRIALLAGWHRCEFHLQRGSDGLRDFVLDGEHVGQFPIVPL